MSQTRWIGQKSRKGTSFYINYKKQLQEKEKKVSILVCWHLFSQTFEEEKVRKNLKRVLERWGRRAIEKRGMAIHYWEVDGGKAVTAMASLRLRFRHWLPSVRLSFLLCIWNPSAKKTHQRPFIPSTKLLGLSFQSRMRWKFITQFSFLFWVGVFKV